MTSTNTQKMISCSSISTTVVNVPCWFIYDYMPRAQSGHTKVYLYLLTSFSQSNTSSISLEEVSQILDMLYSEVISALKYWNTEGVVKFIESSSDTFELSFIMDKPVRKTLEKSEKPILRQTKPQYCTEEINLYVQHNPPVLKLFKLAEQYLGRLLTLSDQKILFSLYDWLHMPFDLIEFLVESCASNNHTSIQYIERVAISWVDEGITSIDLAKNKVLNDKRYFKILNTLGASKQNLTPIEKNCMNKWFNDYNFSMEIILEACKRTVMQTNKPSLNYTDSILTSWYTEKVKSVEDIFTLDKVYESKKTINSSSSPTIRPISNKISQFNSMYSHDWDFDELEKLQREHITRKLNGGS